MKEYVMYVKCYNARTNRYFNVRYNIGAFSEKDAFIRLIITAYENLNKWETIDTVNISTIIER